MIKSEPQTPFHSVFLTLPFSYNLVLILAPTRWLQRLLHMQTFCIFSLPPHRKASPRWCHASFLPLGFSFQRLIFRDWKTQLKSPASERPWLKSWYQNSSLTCLCFPLAASQWISLFFGLCEWLPPPLALQPLSISVPAKGIRRGLRKSYRRTITGNWHNR